MRKAEIATWLEQREPGVVLDVRTPAEYAAGHIPGAVNLPLFSNEERVVVGTLYKQVSPQAAFQKGLKYAGAKLAWYVSEAERLSPNRQVTIHCWRGGQRSGSLAWLLSFAGFEVTVLQGGYKAYRRHILAEFESRSMPYLILGGPTGSGKTALLHQMERMGEQILDLEKLAHHKGSSFGALGELPQPSVEQFENNLYAALHRLEPGRRVWVENESRSIGRVFLPEGLWHRLQRSPLIEVHMPFEARVNHLVEGYGQFSGEELEAAFVRIERKLGGQFVKAALESLQQGDYAAAAAIALKYYDKTYAYTTSKGLFDPRLKLEISGVDTENDARILIDYAESNRL
ncbi:MAG: tRNA 2-selenouridine(34) synthase MnmH [Haliscomenobacter sp.]